MLKRLLKRSVLMAMAIAFSSLVAADCAQTCQEKYDDCMLGAHSLGQQGICREMLHKCQMDCGQ